MDGQNLVHAARETFGYTCPNYDVSALAEEVCTGRRWDLAQAPFYTGIPDAGEHSVRHYFWSQKLAAMGRQSVVVCSRPLRFRNLTVPLPNGTRHSFRTGEEKGIDVRIALYVMALAHRREFDVALVMSQDKDLSEAAEEVRRITREERQ